jgi:hypothetical protein
MFFIGLIKGHKNGNGHDAHQVLEQVYSRGNCYMFARTLQFVFPEGEILSTPLFGAHVVTKIDDRYYDISGEVLEENRFCRLSSLYPLSEEEHKIAQTWCYSHALERCIGLLDDSGNNIRRLDSLEFDENRNAFALPKEETQEELQQVV